jgi:site-specific recombinase XerD
MVKIWPSKNIFKRSLRINSMTTSAYESSVRFVYRLGAHHFAHVRALAEGLDVVSSAQRYLGIEHGNQAQAASRQTVDALRAIANRRNEPAWRLIGLTIQVKGASTQPSLQAFIEERDLDDWSETEVSAMYAEIYPLDPKVNKRIRLREKLLNLLSRLEKQVAEQPQASDQVSGWFDETLAHKLITAGILTLGELRHTITVGGRWYRALPGVGAAKAARMEAYLRQLLAFDGTRATPCFALPWPATTPALTLDANSGRVVHALPASAATDLRTDATHSSTAFLSTSLLAANSDPDAVQAWIAARASSPATTKSYRREATRLLLWLQHACAGATLAQMRIEDCNAYMAFLQNIPASWISRRSATPGQPGWAPFRGPLSHDSQQQTIVIVASLFTWLQSAQYLQGNPWVLVNKKTGDDRLKNVLDTKAFIEPASAAILQFIDQQAPSPARARIRFIVVFLSAVGLRSSELLSAKLEQIQLEPEGWLLQVRGKGAKNRIVHLPGQAMAALRDYLTARDIFELENANPDLPLLANLKDPTQPLGYQALYEHVTSWLGKAVLRSALPASEKSKLVGASTHWLRHTFGTRAVALEVPLDVIQAQLGHASIQTTMDIYGKAPIKRRAEALSTAFD